MVLVPAPGGTSLISSAKGTEKQIATFGAAAKFSAKELNHRRGDGPACNVGVSHGIGSEVPHNVGQGNHGKLSREFLENPDVIRMATLQVVRQCSFGPLTIRKI